MQSFRNNLKRASDLQYFKKNVPTEFIEGLSVAHLFAEVEEALAQLCGQTADRANNYLVDAKRSINYPKD